MSRLIETHHTRNPRLWVFYAAVAGLLLVLISGLVYRQLIKSHLYSGKERLQNLRRVVVPGPRGYIYDRDGKIMVAIVRVFRSCLIWLNYAANLELSIGKLKIIISHSRLPSDLIPIK